MTSLLEVSSGKNYLCSKRLMLPLSLLRSAINHPMSIELKNGETYNGHLMSSDSYMNIFLRQVIITSRDGDRFWNVSECYIRGNTVKYLRLPTEVLDKAQQEEAQYRARHQLEKNKNRSLADKPKKIGSKMGISIGKKKKT